MIFEKKVDRAMDWLKEQNKDEHVSEGYVVDETLLDEASNLQAENTIEEEIEKNDILAIFIAAFLMFTPAILLVLGLFVLLGFLFF